MPQTSMQELNGIAGSSKEFLSEHLMDFLETTQTKDVSQKLKNEVATTSLKPVEAFELEVKDKMSNAAHEILQCIERIEDAMKQNTEMDIKNYLRYARTNLEEANRDIEAAEHAYKALEIYQRRIEKASVVLGKELEVIMTELFNKMEQLKSYQKVLMEKCSMAINNSGVE